MPILETKELSYVYGQGTPFEKRAVDSVSIAIDEGEFVGVIGHTGSGKSTLVQHLNGLIKPPPAPYWWTGGTFGLSRKNPVGTL